MDDTGNVAGGAATDDEVAAARHLLTAAAVRERCRLVAGLVEEGRSPRFRMRRERLADARDRVVALIRSRFPDLSVPLHSRWRHFEAGDVDRWSQLAAVRGWASAGEAARAAADLAILSVLVDAGAGPDWRYVEGATGETYARSEGLAVASLAMFAAGLFSGVPADPLRVDAGALEALSADELAAGFQAGPDNPLVGLTGRRDLLVRLAAAIRARPDIFAVADDPRPGGIVDYLAEQASGGTLPATAILSAVLDGLGPIWPGRIELGGVSLGDAWRHPDLAGLVAAAGGPAAGADIVPFHKLSQWLSYSLVEPLGLLGIAVVDLDGLTGLAEYRNGGLFLDTGAIELVDPADATRPLPVDDPVVVEWRALTVALLDDLAPMVRQAIGATSATLPLCAILEGGTWLAGRTIARERRADGGPPLVIVSDGTVF